MLTDTHPLYEAEVMMMVWFEKADPFHFVEFAAVLPKNDPRFGKLPPSVVEACRVQNLEQSFDSPIADWILRMSREKREIYYGVCPRADLERTEKGGVKPGKKEQVTHAVGAWMDLDSPRWKEQLEQEKLPATFIVSSGGGAQVLFRYAESVPVGKAIEDCKAVARRSGGDDVWNPNRYMRLPGTKNWKGWWDEHKGGRPCTLFLAMPEQVRSISLGVVEDVDSIGDISKLSPDFRDVILNGHDVGMWLVPEKDRTGETDRSQVDYHLMTTLLLKGWSREQIFSLYQNPDYAIGAKYFEEGPNGIHYLEQSIGAAESAANVDRTQWGVVGDILAIQTAKELSKAPPLTFAVDALLPSGGMMMMSGAAKAGKSMLASDLMLLLAGAPGEFLERFKVRDPGPVLYCQAEISQPDLKDRLNCIAQSRKVLWTDLPLFFYHGPFNLAQGEHVTALKRALEKMRAKYLIVDPLARYHNCNENSQAEMGRVLANFERAARDMGLSGGILIHHHGKPSSDSPKEGAHKARGASVIADWANSHVVVNKLWSDVNSRKYVRVVFELRSAEEPPAMSLQLDRKSRRFVKFSEEDERLGVALGFVAEEDIPKDRKVAVRELAHRLDIPMTDADNLYGKARAKFVLSGGKGTNGGVVPHGGNGDAELPSEEEES